MDLAALGITPERLLKLSPSELKWLDGATKRMVWLEAKEACEASLPEFIKQSWHVVEPGNPYVHGWHIDAICEHLEAITNGVKIEGKLFNRLLINCPPGAMKSLLVNVFWPSWEWGPKNLPHLRYVCVSHAQDLSIRDSMRMRRLVMSEWYQERWGKRVSISEDQNQKSKFENTATGFRQAAAAGSVTGARGDRVLVDDPHSVEGGTSDTMRETTVQWFLEAVPTRVNNPKESAIVVIMQRLHEEDVSGIIISKNLGYEHLCLPMRFEEGRRCETGIGFVDARGNGDLLFPERFPEEVVARDEEVLGPFATAGQYQQRPEPRGGGILKTEWWQEWDDEAARIFGVPDAESYPQMELILASVDTAYTTKEENDPSAMTVWGLFRDPITENPQLMLMHAWAKRLELHGPAISKQRYDETAAEYLTRCKAAWGLTEWVMHTCKKNKVDKLLIEAKASGISVYQEIRRLQSLSDWQTSLINPGAQDKVSRAYAVQPIFAAGQIWAPSPSLSWVDIIISQCIVRGTMILTDRGAVPAEEVGVGDRVLTHRGRFRPVMAISCRRAASTLTVSPKSLDALTLTPEHPFYAARLSATRELEEIGWVKAADMVAREYRPVTRGDRTFDEAYPSPCHAALLPIVVRENPIDEIDLREWATISPGKDFEIIEGHGFVASTHHRSVAFKAIQKLDYEFGWVMGLYLAEGSARRQNAVWSLNRETELPLAERVQRFLAERLNVVARFEIAESVINVRASMPMLTEFFRECGSYAYEKHIPEWMWDAPDTFLTGVLDGYIDGDGCHQKNQIIATTVSPSLAWGIRLLALRLGINAIVRVSREPKEQMIAGRKCSTRRAYAVSWRKDRENNGAALFIDNAVAYSIMEAAQGPRDVDVYNFDVAEDHSYCTTGGLVHNCASFPKAAHDDLVDSLTQAINWFRMSGLLKRPAEVLAEHQEQERYKKKVPAIYDV